MNTSVSDTLCGQYIDLAPHTRTPARGVVMDSQVKFSKCSVIPHSHLSITNESLSWRPLQAPSTTTLKVKPPPVFSPGTVAESVIRMLPVLDPTVFGIIFLRRRRRASGNVPLRVAALDEWADNMDTAYELELNAPKHPARAKVNPTTQDHSDVYPTHTYR